MEKLELGFHGKLPRNTYRVARTESIKQEATKVIDGDYVEAFLSMDQKQQQLVMSGVNKDSGFEVTKEVRQIIEILKELH